MKDFYYILGTDSKATGSDLNAAYRKLAKKLQPNGQDDDDFIDHHFREITEAYQTLSDPIARRRYDARLRKAHQNRFYFFKIKYINIAVTLALVTFTALFGYYVSQSLKGRSKAPKTTSNTPTIAPLTVKHFKRKRIPKSINNTTIKRPVVSVDTLSKHSFVAAVPPRVAQAPILQVITKERVEERPTPDPVNVTTEIRANATGLVYLHQLANYRSAVLASIPDHAKVQVLEKGDGFYKITYQDQTGYVPKWTVAGQ